jgi:UDP-N-acetylmuramoyl-tripeptide--D-alanyl-D-alanine ligase
VGGDYSKVKHDYINLASSVQAKDWFRQQLFKNTQILIKGSRSMQMEKVLP